jgi:hypothetical protein
VQRVSVTAARLQGLEEDLKLTGMYINSSTAYDCVKPPSSLLDLQYSVVLSIVYASYCPVQLPSNMVIFLLIIINTNDQKT